jgi:hypothetical protein
MDGAEKRETISLPEKKRQAASQLPMGSWPQPEGTALLPAPHSQNPDAESGTSWWQARSLLGARAPWGSQSAVARHDTQFCRGSDGEKNGSNLGMGPKVHSNVA